jgi:energy-converting hydrogenase Eha subunit F
LNERGGVSNEQHGEVTSQYPKCLSVGIVGRAYIKLQRDKRNVKQERDIHFMEGEKS